MQVRNIFRHGTGSEYSDMKRAESPLLQGLIRISMVSFLFLFASLGWCGQSIPGEDRSGWLYSMTHLHPLAYVICFLILALSVINIWFQSKHSVQRIGAISLWGSLKDAFSGVSSLNYERRNRPRKLRKPAVGDEKKRRSFRMGIEAVVPSEVVGAPRMSTPTASPNSVPSMPTPLDGINHPLPDFSEIRGAMTDDKGKNQQPLSKSQKLVDFRFSSAVDFPTAEEIERRDHQQLTVSGLVRGVDGKGLPSVLVYLTDLEGNRYGQSCRTLPDTGEYKVIAGEPGRYLLKAYKRGMIMEGAEAISLQMEAGKVEGLNFRMIPDGCVVKGVVRTKGTAQPFANTTVRCLSRLGDYSGESVTDQEGNFTIVGVPPNCECFVEVIGSGATRIYLSENFETVQKTQIELEIAIAPTEDSRPLENVSRGVFSVNEEVNPTVNQSLVEEAPKGAAPASPLI